MTDTVRSRRDHRVATRRQGMLLPSRLLIVVGSLLLQGACTPSMLTDDQVSPTSGQKAMSLDLGEGVGMQLVFVPGTNKLTDRPCGGADTASGIGMAGKSMSSFYIGKYEVTQRQWMQVIKHNPSLRVGADLPVHGVSWRDCVQFCDQVSARTGRVVRLPFRAEWLYAYRLGFAAEPEKLDVSWEPAAPASSPAMEAVGGRGRVQPVGSGPPNNLDIYDMEGNVREWCCDAIVERLTSSGSSDAGQGSEILYRCVEGG